MADTPATLSTPVLNTQTDRLPSFPWPTLLLLYLGPGLIMTIFYVIVAPLFVRAGLPAVWGLLIGALAVIIPLELAILLLYSRQMTGQLGLRPSVVYLERLPFRQYLWLVPVAVLASFLLPGLVVLLEPWIRTSLFSWLPTWFSAGLTNIASYPPPIQWATAILWIVFVVIVGPIVEELYFRGFLMPRTAQGGSYAPLLNAFLFALYHFWQPYAVLTITLFALPLAYLVWWKRSVAISMIAHCSINMLAIISLFAGVVQR